MLKKALVKIADGFASVVLRVYALLVVISAASVVYYVRKNDWAQVEPLMFLLFLPFLYYTIEVVFYAITKKQISLIPHYLYERLRVYKLRRVEREFGLEGKSNYQDVINSGLDIKGQIEGYSKEP